jgi:hypothetical protein
MFSIQHGDWSCPVCYNQLPYCQLLIDENFENLLAQTPDSDDETVEIHNSKYDSDSDSEKPDKKVDDLCIILDSDDEGDPPAPTPTMHNNAIPTPGNDCNNNNNISCLNPAILSNTYANTNVAPNLTHTQPSHNNNNMYNNNYNNSNINNNNNNNNMNNVNSNLVNIFSHVNTHLGTRETPISLDDDDDDENDNSPINNNNNNNVTQKNDFDSDDSVPDYNSSDDSDL